MDVTSTYLIGSVARAWIGTGVLLGVGYQGLDILDITLPEVTAALPHRPSKFVLEVCRGKSRHYEAYVTPAAALLAFEAVPEGTAVCIRDSHGGAVVVANAAWLKSGKGAL